MRKSKPVADRAFRLGMIVGGAVVFLAIICTPVWMGLVPFWESVGLIVLTLIGGAVLVHGLEKSILE